MYGYVKIQMLGIDMFGLNCKNKKERDGVFSARGDTGLNILGRAVGSEKIKCGG